MAGLKCSKDVLQNQLLSIPQLWFPPHWLHPQTRLLQGVAVIITRSSWLTFHHLASSDSSNKNLGLTSIGLTRLTYPSVNQGSSLSGWASVAWPLLTQGGAVSPAHTTWAKTLGNAQEKTGIFFSKANGSWVSKTTALPHWLCWPCVWILDLRHLFLCSMSLNFLCLKLNRQFDK